MPSFGKKSISEDEESDDMGSLKPTLNHKKVTKKRKKNVTKQEEEEDELEKKKLMKKEKKPKQKATPKKKAPLDLDRQCGVLIAPNNNPCTRSLTCKIHSMGAKRAVEGRSQPFNELLAAYQKKGIGRPQVPSSDPNKIKKKKDNNDISTTTSSLTLNKEVEEEEDEDVDIDSDEETASVKLAIEQNKPVPLGSKKFCYVRRKRKYYKLRDILLEAITPKDNNTSAIVSAGGEISLDF